MRQRTFRLLVLAGVGLPILGVGIFAGLYYWNLHREAHLEEAMDAVRKADGKIEHEGRSVKGPVHGVNLMGKKLTPELMKLLPRFDCLKELNLTWSNLTDDLLWPVKLISSLETLYVASNAVTAAGVKQLRDLSRLSELSLDATQVTDGCLDDVAAMKGLRGLHLGNTAVTDSGLRKLHGMTQLEHIYLNGSNVTDAGVAELQKALPGVRVHR
jgi:hypothetical protein